MKSPQIPEDWIAVPVEDRADIADHLLRLLRSPAFCNSKRYPQLLEHCANLSFSGETDRLRERQLGVDLFGRPSDYDTSSDPIVRVTAAEVRKRLIQYYDGPGRNDTWIFEFAPGAYAVGLHRAFESQQGVDASVGTHQPTEHLEVRSARELPLLLRGPSAATGFRRYTFALIGLSLAAALGLMVWKASPTQASSPFWRGMTRPGQGTIAVLGQLPGESGPVDQPLSREIFRASESVSVDGAISAIALCSSLARHAGACRLSPASKVSISELQRRPAIVIGAYSNPWTLRIADELPFRFGPLDCKCIVEARTGQQIGRVDFSLPKARIQTDYSIVSRFQSHLTDGPVVLVAGIAPMSTRAAAEYVSSIENSEVLTRLAPKAWAGGNFELILSTEIVDGIPSHTQPVRASFW